MVKTPDKAKGTTKAKEAKEKATPRDWHKLWRVHPYAEKFGPPLSQGDFEALKLNIEEHGLRIKVPIWKDKESETGWSILGGRHRLEAMIALGMEATTPKGPVPYRSEYFDRLPDNTDPLAYVVSENLIRRQLTAEQKEALADELIKLRPNENNLRLAKLLRMSPTFVGKRRDKLEQAGDVSTVETRTDSKGRKQPAKKARAKADDDSTASKLPKVEIATEDDEPHERWTDLPREERLAEYIEEFFRENPGSTREEAEKQFAWAYEKAMPTREEMLERPVQFWDDLSEGAKNALTDLVHEYRFCTDHNRAIELGRQIIGFVDEVTFYAKLAAEAEAAAGEVPTAPAADTDASKTNGADDGDGLDIPPEFDRRAEEVTRRQ